MRRLKLETVSQRQAREAREAANEHAVGIKEFIKETMAQIKQHDDS